MKKTITLSFAFLMVGCAAQTARTASVPPLEPSHTSSALAFDPPIAQAEPTPDLSRDNRGQAALVGFEEPATSSYDVFTYNRQANDNGSYYDKEAITEKVGTTHR